MASLSDANLFERFHVNEALSCIARRRRQDTEGGASALIVHTLIQQSYHSDALMVLLDTHLPYPRIFSAWEQSLLILIIIWHDHVWLLIWVEIGLTTIIVVLLAALFLESSLISTSLFFLFLDLIVFSCSLLKLGYDKWFIFASEVFFIVFFVFALTLLLVACVLLVLFFCFIIDETTCTHLALFGPFFMLLLVKERLVAVFVVVVIFWAFVWVVLCFFGLLKFG